MVSESTDDKSPTPGGFRPLDFAMRYGLLIILAGMIVYFWQSEPAFLRVTNVFLILQSVSIVAILALGVTATLVINGLDLSIGAVASLSLMASSYMMVVLGWGPFETILACLAIGLFIGFCNGAMIVWLKVPDLLATLGMMFLLIGLQRIPTAGRSIAAGMTLPNGDTATGSFAESFLAMGRHRLFDVVPVPVIIMIVLAVAIWFFLEFTRWGRVMYAIGSNEHAARLAGAPVKRYRIAAYMISGAFASIGGMILAARVGRGDVGSGQSLLLDSVAAALIGFAVLGAAKPNAFGTAIGALFVGTLLNGLTMLNAPYYTQDFVKGLVLVIALQFTFGLRGRRN